MNHKRKLLLFMLCIVQLVDGREFLTPTGLLNLQTGYMHAILERPTCEESCWNFDAWGIGWHREAEKAFTNKMGTKTDASLAGIIFGKESFVVLDAFAPGTVSPNNIFLGIATLTPNISFSENSAYVAATYERVVGNCRRWHIGARVSIPFRAVKTKLNNCCELDNASNIENFYSLQYERLNNAAVAQTPETVGKTFAYRLDFLSALHFQQAGVDPLSPYVNFANPNASNHITINNIDVTDANNSPVTVIQRDNGTVPQGVYSVEQAAALALPNLPADGAGLANNQRAKFSQGINYTLLGGNVAKQSELWVVPTIFQNPNDGNSLTLVEDANAIYNKTEDLINVARSNGSAIDFLIENGVSLDSHSFTGIGDVDAMVYALRDLCDGFIEGFVGLRLPTGLKVKDPKKVLSIITTGNNHHTELRGGIVAQWIPTCWCILQADASATHAFKSNERVAAPFVGATVKNIGPTINADIKWNYFMGDIGATFLIPKNPGVGFMVGYQWYVKGKDSVSLNASQAVDFLGNIQPLDSEVLEERTQVTSHKICTEFFHQGERWELFGGFTHCIAGKNAPKETLWYLGFAAYF